MNELVKAKIIADLGKVQERDRKRLRKFLASIKVWEKGHKICFHYENGREWREKHRAILKTLHDTYIQLPGDTFLFCSCNQIPMLIAKTGELHHLRTFPEKRKEHDSSCPFYDEPVDTQAIWRKWNSGKIKETLLEIPKMSSPVRSPSEEIKEIRRPLTSSNKPKQTFVRTILSLIDDAYGYSFNYINKGIDRLKESEKLFLPTVGEVVSALKKKLREKTPENFRCFVNLVGSDQIELSESYLELRLAGLDRKIPISKNQTFFWDLWETGFAGSTGKFLNVNFQKRGRITRAFFMPLLYLEEDRPFIPIESRNEAEKVERLLAEGKKLFKVITGTLSKNLCQSLSRKVRQFSAEKPDLLSGLDSF